MGEKELLASEVATLVWMSGIAKTLGVIYERLFQIEMNEESVSDYNDLLKEARKYSNRLNELCLKLNPTKKKIQLYEKFLLRNGTKYCKEDDNALIAIYGVDIKSLWINRVMNQIKRMSNSNNVNLFMDINNKVCDVHQVIQEVKIGDAIRSDFERAFVYYLDDIANSDDDLSWSKDSFCEMKYKLRFISESVENEFLYGKDTEDCLYFSFPLVSDLVSASDSKRYEVQQVLGQDYCMIAIDNLLEFAHIDTDDAKISRNALLAYLKSGLSVLFTHQNYDEIVDDFKEQIQYEESGLYYLQGHTDFLFECFDDAEYDKRKCKYLSLVKQK